MSDETPETDETPEKDASEAEPATAEAQGAVAEAEPGADPHDELDAAEEAAPAKPKRVRSRKKAETEAAAKDGGESAEEPAAEPSAGEKAEPPKPKRARSRKKAETEAVASAETSAAAEERPKTRSRRSSPAQGQARRPRPASAGAGARGSRPVVRAQAKYVRTSARKARMVCGHIRGKSVAEARAILAFTPRQVARDWAKVLDSAVANAENNHELVEDDLIVREAYADEGPTIKRFRPRARGRASSIRKRTSHLTITLTPGD
jgi:ribosomal protein L22